MKTKLFLAALTLVSLLLAVAPLQAQTVTWDRKAFGQQFTCPNGASGGYTWPNNNNWSQAQRIETTNQCGPPQTVETQPSNWSTPNYPNSPSANVVIPASQPVRLDVGATVGTLQLGTGASLLMDRASLTVANGSVVNNGTIKAQNNLGAAYLVFTSNGTISGSGDIICSGFRGSDNGAGIATTNGATVTLAAGQTIHGVGFIDAQLINNGLVSSDASTDLGPLKSLSLGEFAMTNNATMKAVDGHFLSLTKTNLTQSSSGQLLADGGTIDFNGATVTNGTFNAANGGTFRGAGVTLNNVTNNAPMAVNGYGVNGSLINNNTISVLGNPYRGALTAVSNTTISGTGKITMTQGSYSAIDTAAGATLTQAAGHTINGSGDITASLVNNGSIVANGYITFTNSDKVNNGLIATQSGGGSAINGITMTQGNTGQMAADGARFDLNGGNNKLATIVGGTLSSSNNGFVFANGASLTNLTNNGDLRVNYGAVPAGTLVNNGSISILGNPGLATLEFTGDTMVSGTGSIASVQGSYSLMKIDQGATLTNNSGHTISGNGAIQGSISNKGTIIPDTTHGWGGYLTFQASSITTTGLTNDGGTVIAPADGGLSFETAVPFAQTAGTIDLQGGTISAPSGIDLNGGLLAGSGTINGSIRNNGGVVSPGHSPGKITINGNYTQGAGGTLTMEIGGTAAGTDYDQLKVNGTATLGGTLNVSLINGFRPAVGDILQLILPNALAGTFAAINTVGFTAHPTYSSSAITLTVTTVPDIPLNISTRLQVGRDPDQLIGGFIITGTEAKKVIILATGPSLSAFGLTGVLADPILELYKGSQLIATNDNWKIPAQAEIEATGFAPKDPLESALVRTLVPGDYTAVVRGTNGTGIGTVQIYDLAETSKSKLANISSRGRIEPGDGKALIAGFIIGGNGGGDSRVIVRALGPSITGIAGVLPDPAIELKNANGSTVTSNDDWEQSPDKAEISARGFAPPHRLESALITSLPKGAFTAIVRGKGSDAGVAVVEVYNVD